MKRKCAESEQYDENNNVNNLSIDNQPEKKHDFVTDMQPVADIKPKMLMGPKCRIQHNGNVASEAMDILPNEHFRMNTIVSQQISDAKEKSVHIDMSNNVSHNQVTTSKSKSIHIESKRTKRTKRKDRKRKNVKDNCAMDKIIDKIIGVKTKLERPSRTHAVNMNNVTTNQINNCRKKPVESGKLKKLLQIKLAFMESSEHPNEKIDVNKITNMKPKPSKENISDKVDIMNDVNPEENSTFLTIKQSNKKLPNWSNDRIFTPRPVEQENDLKHQKSIDIITKVSTTDTKTKLGNSGKIVNKFDTADNITQLTSSGKQLTQFTTPDQQTKLHLLGVNVFCNDTNISSKSVKNTYNVNIIEEKGIKHNDTKGDCKSKKRHVAKHKRINLEKHIASHKLISSHHNNHLNDVRKKKYCNSKLCNNDKETTKKSKVLHTKRLNSKSNRSNSQSKTKHKKSISRKKHKSKHSSTDYSSNDKHITRDAHSSDKKKKPSKHTTISDTNRVLASATQSSRTQRAKTSLSSPADNNEIIAPILPDSIEVLTAQLITERAQQPSISSDKDATASQIVECGTYDQLGQYIESNVDSIIARTVNSNR